MSWDGHSLPEYPSPPVGGSSGHCSQDRSGAAEGGLLHVEGISLHAQVFSVGVYLQSHLRKTWLSCNRRQGSRWTLLAPRGARWRLRGTNESSDFKLAKVWSWGCRGSEASSRRSHCSQNQDKKATLQEETEILVGGRLQEDPEPEDSECKTNRVEIKAEKESGDAGFRRELRNSLCSQDT